MSKECEHKTSRHINPFLCSTDNFTEERSFLSANIFPALQDLCRQRAACFQPYDWDHNIGEERLKQGLALQLALKCIEYASPYFIGLLGNEYGHHRSEDSDVLPNRLSDLPTSAHWVDKNIVIAAEHGYSWLLDHSYSGTSLTELKIIQAAFLSDETSYCRFYIRDHPPSTSPQTDLERYDKFKIKQLKTSIAKRGLYVSYYSSLEQLGQMVLDDWTVIIDRLYPPMDTCAIGK